VCQALCLALLLFLSLYVAWPYAQTFTSRVLPDKEWVPAELFLWLDPLSTLSATIAGRHLHVSLAWAAGILAFSLLVPRVFCSHVCPLGTLVDLFDWAIAGRLRRLHVTQRGFWAHAKYAHLGAVLVAAAFGVLLTGYLAAMPVLTRACVFILGPAQLATLKHPGMIRPVSWEYWLSVALFLSILGLSFFGRRFWCRYLCPTGALFSLAGVLRLRERRVKESCIRCGKCVEVCSFDAIRSDFTTRHTECAFCPDCADACPVGAVEFAWRRPAPAAAPVEDKPRLSRRMFGGACAVGAAAALGVALAGRKRLIRPPGSVREGLFLRLCVRCDLCMKVCPGPVLHPAGLEAGLDALWTPVAVPSWAGCHQDCNFCGQVCPTGAIRPLPLEVKKKTRMGLAKVDTTTCLPHSRQEECELCYEECKAAGYCAIKMVPKKLDLGQIPPGVMSPEEIERASEIQVPSMDPDKCVGCGLCEYRCHAALVKQRKLLAASAIVVLPENGDRPG
jgi:ferredoxin